MTITMRRAAGTMEEQAFWGLVEWARLSRHNRNDVDALTLALGELPTLEEAWIAAVFHDEHVRDAWLDAGKRWEGWHEYEAWLRRQPHEVLKAVPGTLRLARDYTRLMTSRSATIRIIHALDEISPDVANQIREAYLAGHDWRAVGTPWALAN